MVELGLQGGYQAYDLQIRRRSEVSKLQGVHAWWKQAKGTRSNAHLQRPGFQVDRLRSMAADDG